MSSCSQIKIPSDFTEITLPKVNSKEWSSLNYSGSEFAVNIDHHQLIVSKAGNAGRCELKLSNGILKGIDRGEWGGELSFIPSDSLQQPIKVKDGNIKFIFVFEDKVYFIEGLAHLSISEGTLFEINVEDGFTYKKILDFEDAPEAFTIYQDQLLIASHENFYVIQDFKIQTIFQNTFWSSLYPNSIAIEDEENVFMGMRGGIAKLDLVNKTMKFFKYNE